MLAGTSTGLFGQMLYIGNNADGTISSYVIDQENGNLTEILPRVGTPGHPTSVTVHPSGKFAYTTNTGDQNLGGPGLGVYSINGDTGALKLLGSTTTPNGSTPQAVVTDPAGKFAFVALQGANSIAVYSIDSATGGISAVTGSPFATPAGPSSVVVHPNGKFAYASAAGAGQIAAFSIGANGALTPVAGSPFAARNNLFWMAMDPAGKFLFAAQRAANGVLVYSVDANTGALTLVNGSPFSVSGAISGVAVDPTGKFLYASNIGGTVHGFTIGATGALTPIAPGFYPAVIGAFAVILDPSGKFLYVPGNQSNAVSAYSIDAGSGALTSLQGSPFRAGGAPQRGASVLLNPPVIPPISAESVYNYFSHSIPGMPNAGIAQGARLGISGKNIGPVGGVGSDFPLQTELGGASIQIQSGDVTTAALMVYASTDLVTGVVPSNTPLGDATVTVTYKGRKTAPLPVTIVPVSPGIRTLNDQGSGPAKAYNATSDFVLTIEAVTGPSSLVANTLNASAKPGQNVGLTAMGLGAATFDETQFSSQAMDVPLDVLIANKPATVLAKLRITSGNDLILIKLPDDAPEGCYVPVVIRAGGVISNVASISIAANGGSCSDAAGLAASDIELAQKSGQLSMGAIDLTHFDLGPGGISDDIIGVFGRYDFGSLQAALAPGFPGNGIRGVASTPPLGSCVVSRGTPTKRSIFDLDGDPVNPFFLNAGGALNLSGPAGRAQLPAPGYEFSPDAPAFTPGDYTIDNGTGTQAVGGFKGVLTLPPMVNWTNKDSMSAIDRTKDLTVTWSGGAPDKEFAMILGLSVNQQVAMGFLCTEKVSAGTFTVPSWVLSSLPKSDFFQDQGTALPGGLLAVGTSAFTNTGRFTAPGLDFAVFTYEQAAATFVPFQ